MTEVFVKMTEEDAARRWAGNEGLCLIDWETLEELVHLAPIGMVIFQADKFTYKLSDIAKQLRSKRFSADAS